MKKIFILLILIPFISKAQIDSSKSKVSVTCASKTWEYVCLLFEKSNKYEDLDSTLRSKYRVSSPPSGNTAVKIDSIEGRIFADLYGKLQGDFIAVSDTNKYFKDFENGIRNSGGVWLNNKTIKAKGSLADQGDLRRQAGRDYLRKQQN